MRSAFALLLFFAFVAILLLTPNSAQSATPLRQIAYWKFDEIRTDLFSDTLSATEGVCADGCPTAVRGIDVAAQRFDGTAGIELPAQAEFVWNDRSEFTIELWLKAEPGQTCATSDEVMVGFGDESVGGWSLGCAAENGRVQFWLADARGNSFVLQSNRAITDGRWHHIVAQRDGVNDVNILIVDGKDVVSGVHRYRGSFGAGTAVLQVGAWGESGRFVGTVDELSLYEGLLPQKEILTHYYIARAYGDGCATEVKIMPLGDSITRGYGTAIGSMDPTNPSNNFGYRWELDNLLNNANYNFDFVGSQTEPIGGSFDLNHEGHGGFRADQIAGVLNGYLTQNPPELILLHIGTNDIAQGQGTSAADVGTILDGIDTFDEQITVILALIVDQKPDDPQYMVDAVNTFNNNLQSLAQARISDGDKIILVNQNTALNYPADMFDWLHPQLSGYNKMSNVWFNELDTILPDCTAPVIATTPATTASVGDIYIYDVDAAGYSDMTFTLTAAPNGMSISPSTGLITWTPTNNQSGSHTVTVEVSNTVGSDSQTYTLIVNYEVYLPTILRNP